MYQVCDWSTHEVIAEFYTEDARDEWMEDNCEWYWDECIYSDHYHGITRRVYRQRT